MTLTPGTRVGSYEVVTKLGEGGMGEVYRARDARLDRHVALKVLPDAFSADPDRLARFEREAKTLASLSHPNIAGIFGIEGRALVMELVEGEDLSAHIARGPMPLTDALAVARQISDALEAAHESGIVHRDLKPGNVKVRPDGTVKVLDFGLAKVLGPDTADGANPSTSPTLTARATQMGMIIGTAAYMAPEQARGRAVDRRADIWAFGVVLYEMLSGRRAFDGDDVSITLAGVLKEDVKWDALPGDLPPALRTLIRRCLEKDPKRRLGWIGEARVVLDDPAGIVEAAAPSQPAPAPPRWRRALPWALAAAGILSSISVLMIWAPWRDAAPAAPRRLFASLGPNASLLSLPGGSVALSPDGATLAFAATAGSRTQLFVRRLDQLDAVALAGTDGAFAPFFSPRGDWLGFFASGEMKKVAVTGGAAVTVCPAQGGRGAAWLADDTIVFTPSGLPNVKLMRVPAAGGQPVEFGTFSEGGITQRWPQALPGGTHVLYTENTAVAGFDTASLVVAPLSGGPPTVVHRGGFFGRYVPASSDPGEVEGYLVYIHQGTLFAAPFDLSRMAVAGQPLPAAAELTSNTTTAGAQLAVSSDGTLVYLPGTTTTLSGTPILWVTRDGKTAPLRSASTPWTEPRFSPDGTKLAMVVSDGKQTDIWIYEWSRDTMTQLTFDPGRDRTPVWSPDGSRIVYASDRAKVGGPTNLYVMNADGSGGLTRLTESDRAQVAFSWTPKSDTLLFQEQRPATGFDLLVLPLSGDAKRGWTAGTPTEFLVTPGIEVYPRISPDGRWLAYFSTESGASVPEVYVRPFPGPGGKWKISPEFGVFPQWSETSRELLFLNPTTNRILVAPYTVVGDAFRADTPRNWTDAQFPPSRTLDPYAIHPDGKRLAAWVEPAETAGSNDKVVFFLNFAEYLRALTKRE